MKTHVDIQHSKPTLEEADVEAVSTQVRSGLLTDGRTVRQLELDAARYLGGEGAVICGSGTAALVLILKALGIGCGHDVILPTYVCRAVAEAVHAVGATPVVCDVGDDWCITNEGVAQAFSSRTRAIVLVHTFGIRADCQPLREFGVPLIEDACQAFGAIRAGTPGDAAFYSFHATKCLTTGEGGMAMSPDPALVARMRHLLRGSGDHLQWRYAAPMTDMQAALGLSQLQRYSWFLRRRKELAATYFARLQESPVILPEAVRERSLFFRFPVRQTRVDFDRLRERMATAGVQIRRGVDALLHRHYRDGVQFRGSYPVAERLFLETVSLPIYPSLSDAEQELVCRTFDAGLRS